MKAYNFNLDVIRAAAILAVVAIHVWYPVYSRPDFLGGISWWLAEGINTVSRVAVPWFIMVSGALLIPRRPKKQFRDIAGRLIWRLGLPLLFWSTAYFYWDYYYYGRLTYPDQAIRVFLSGSVFHLYFLVILFGLYLLLPLVRQIKITPVKLIISFIAGTVLYALQFFVYGPKTIFNFLTLCLPYLGYFLAGPFLFSLPRKRQKLIAALWLVSAGLTLGLGYYNLVLLKREITIFWTVGGTDYFTHWLAPNVVLMSLTGFYLLSHYQFFLPVWLNRAVQLIARSALGIYLIHMLVINILDKYFRLYLDYGHTQLWWYGSYKTLLVFLVSLGSVQILKRIPALKIIIGEK